MNSETVEALKQAGVATVIGSVLAPVLHWTGFSVPWNGFLAAIAGTYLATGPEKGLEQTSKFLNYLPMLILASSVAEGGMLIVYGLLSLVFPGIQYLLIVKP